MFSIAQRIESLRMERNISRPALAAELGFPKMAFERFETGRQTPTQAQQERIAAYFGVSVAYLRGESITLTDSSVPRGFAIVAYRGLPLGFVKNLGNRCNSLHPQHRRIRMDI